MFYKFIGYIFIFLFIISIYNIVNNRIAENNNICKQHNCYCQKINKILNDKTDSIIIVSNINNSKTYKFYKKNNIIWIKVNKVDTLLYIYDKNYNVLYNNLSLNTYFNNKFYKLIY